MRGPCYLVSATKRCFAGRLCIRPGQLAWAWLVIYGELPEQPTGATKIAAVVEQIQDQLSLKLLRGRKTADVTADGEPLSVVNRYDPAVFQANMANSKAPSMRLRMSRSASN